MRNSLALVVFLFLVGCARMGTPSPTPTAIPTPVTPQSKKVESRWIEVVLEEQRVYLWENDRLQVSLPVSTGVGISPGTTTYTGEFKVETMYPGPEETVPGVFVRDIVIFDWEHGNGFHSLPMDAHGVVLDPTVGKPASAGCIRVADSATLYAFARLGMKVIIH